MRQNIYIRSPYLSRLSWGGKLSKKWQFALSASDLCPNWAKSAAPTVHLALGTCTNVHLAPAHCSWETCSIHRSRCGTRSLDKVGHIGNLLPLFSPDFAKICPNSRSTMRRYVIAAGNFRTSKAISLTVCVIYETILIAWLVLNYQQKNDDA